MSEASELAGWQAGRQAGTGLGRQAGTFYNKNHDFIKDNGFEPIQWKYECQGLHLSESSPEMVANRTFWWQKW